MNNDKVVHSGGGNFLGTMHEELLPGQAPLVTSGNPDYIARLAKICERLGYKVTVRE